MTIKEIETLSGLPRANIRYYESEGLIAPKRAENGYREYSQADAEVLLRVKLLRALGLRIDTIKSLAAGTLMLGDALDARLEELHAEQENLDAAGRVTWIAADGSVLYDNSARKDNMENHLAREEIAAALEPGEGRATRDSQTGGARTHYIARRLADGSVLRTACTQTSLARLILNLLLPGREFDAHEEELESATVAPVATSSAAA